jgi:hypothetical protein
MSWKQSTCTNVGHFYVSHTLSVHVTQVKGTASVCLLIKLILVIAFPLLVYTWQVDKGLLCVWTINISWYDETPTTRVVGTPSQWQGEHLPLSAQVQMFAKQTSSGNSATITHLDLCTIHNYWCTCQIHQSWRSGLTVNLRKKKTCALTTYQTSHNMSYRDQNKGSGQTAH